MRLLKNYFDWALRTKKNFQLAFFIHMFISIMVILLIDMLKK